MVDKLYYLSFKPCDLKINLYSIVENLADFVQVRSR